MVALLDTLQDNFNDNTINPALWPNSFGTISETGGRARVQCDTGFNAYSSALAYTLAGSHVYLRAYAHAGGGAATEAWAQILIKSSTSGTDLGFELRMATTESPGDELVMMSREGFFDPAETSIAYSPTDHRWLRVRETGGNVLWDTSPDGTTWTNWRTLASPAWVGDEDLEFQLIAHRSDGTVDFVEFDNVNLISQTLALGPPVETDTGQPLTGHKARPLGVAAGTDTAQILGPRKTTILALAGETTTVLPLGSGKRLALGVAVHAETARPLTGVKRLTAGTTAEADTALALVPLVPHPADNLSAGISWPLLTTSTTGPVLTASVSGGG